MTTKTAVTCPRYAVNHYLCPAEVSLATFIKEVANAGFDGIGLTETALTQLPLPEIRALLDAHKLQVSSINTAGFFLSTDPQQAQQNARLIDAAAYLQASALNVIVGAAGPERSLESTRSHVEDKLATFAQQASEQGVQLVVEPMWIANTFTKSCFQSIAQLIGVFARIPGLKLNLDYYHLWSDPDLGASLRNEGCPIGLLQICDVDWVDAPNQAKRAPLGEGRLVVLDQFHQLGYTGGDFTVELELFIDQLPGRNYVELIRNAARQLII